MGGWRNRPDRGFEKRLANYEQPYCSYRYIRWAKKEEKVQKGLIWHYFFFLER